MAAGDTDLLAAHERRLHLLRLLSSCTSWEVPERQLHLIEELRALVDAGLVKENRVRPRVFKITHAGAVFLETEGSAVALLLASAKAAEQLRENQRRIAENEARDSAVLKALDGQPWARLRYLMHGPAGPRGYKP